jgi:hypothetical protein
LPVPSPDEKGGGLVREASPLTTSTIMATETRTKGRHSGKQLSQEECGAPASMTVADESRYAEVSNPTRTLLGSKRTTKIGFWNVRTMAQSTKSAQVAEEMKRYHLDILGLSEVRWPGTDKRVVSGLTFIYSGREDGKHMEGVGIMMSAGFAKCLLEWEPISSRIIRARFNTRHVKMSVLQCYAPTNDAEAEIKDTFYEQLQDEIDKTPKHDLLIVMGDFNAKVGEDNVGVERAMGREGVDTMNENGERLAELCMQSNLIIGGTIFAHKEIHKLTWHSPDGVTKNQIDHLCINSKFRSSLMDVRAYRGADVGSDHNLCIGQLKLKLKTATKKQLQLRIDSRRLSNSKVQKEFQLELKNRFDELGDEREQNIENKWNNIKTVILEAANNSAGIMKTDRKPWISDNTWQCIHERKTAKLAICNAKTIPDEIRAKEDYRKKDKQVKTAARRDNRAYVDRLAEEGEQAAKVGNSKTLYNTLKQLTGTFKQRGGPIKSKDGTMLTSDAEQKKR